MAIDVNGQFTGSLYGQDRIGQTTPDLESSEWLRPWIPVAYPAPYLPTLRQDQGHPKLAGIVIGSHMLVGQDKNGGLVPAGLFCGKQPTKAAGGQYCVIVYQPYDVGFAYNPQTAARVAVAGETVVLAAPSDAVAGDTVTLPNGTTVNITSPQINFAWSCDLFTGISSNTSGSNLSTGSTTVHLDAVLTGSTTTGAPTAVITPGTSTDHYNGSFTIQSGSAQAVDPVIVPSTTTTASTATYTLQWATNLLSGTLQFKQGTGTLVSVVLSGDTLAQAVTAINAAIAAAGLTGVITATHGSTTLVLTGTEDVAVDGTNTLEAGGVISTPVVVNVSLAQVGGGNSTAAQAVTLINAAIAAAGVAASYAATPSLQTSGVITITGVEDASVNGTNDFTVVSDVEDIGTSGTSIAYSYFVVRPIGCAVRNVYQYIGGVLVGNNTAASSSATGINYTLDGVVPLNFTVLNYMHEMGTAIQTQFVLKLPWIGSTPTELQAIAAHDSISGYLNLFGRTFTHFTGAMNNPLAYTPGGGAAGSFGFGTGVVASSAANGTDAGNFAPFNPSVHSAQDLVGRVIGIQNLAPVGFLNRVRTLFDRPMVGPMTDPNPAAIRMGGSATGGIPYHISVTTDAIFKFAYDQGKTARPEYSTHVLVRVNL